MQQVGKIGVRVGPGGCAVSCGRVRGSGPSQRRVYPDLTSAARTRCRIRLAPRASRLAPRASRLAPRASRLAPRASRLAPRASRLAPRASRLAPRASRLAPRASRLAPLHVFHMPSSGAGLPVRHRESGSRLIVVFPARASSAEERRARADGQVAGQRAGARPPRLRHDRLAGGLAFPVTLSAAAFPGPRLHLPSPVTCRPVVRLLRRAAVDGRCGRAFT